MNSQIQRVPPIVVVGDTREFFRPKKPDAVARVGIEGIVHSVELIDAKTGVVKRRLGPFPNLIVDAGLDGVGSGASNTALTGLTNYLAVGTDNTTPAVGQTSLGAEIARTNSNGGFNDSISSGVDYTYWECARTRLFTEQQALGNLTELGFFNAATSGIMWCRQLFLDDLGQPTTITKTSDDQLRVVYLWRVYPNRTSVLDELTISGVATDCYSRAARIDQNLAWGSGGPLFFLGSWYTTISRFQAFETNTMPALTDTMTGGVGSSSISWQTYTAGNFYRDVGIIWNPAVANFPTGIGLVTPGYWQTAFYPWGWTTFDPKVAKIDTKRFTFTARVVWARKA